MLAYLLAIILQLNNIDTSLDINVLDNDKKENIIEYFQSNKYQAAHVINKYLPPLSQSDFIFPHREISAHSYVVIDIGSGNILLDNNPEQVMPIASLTKLMTAMVFLETNTPFDGEVMIEQTDHNNVSGSQTYLRVGEKMTVQDLFYTSLVGSDNDATSALARSTGLSHDEFISRMNQKAKLMGLKNTSFEEETGLSANNRSTVNEYAKIAYQAFHNLKITEALNKTEYNFESDIISHHIKNTNKLLSDENISLIGAKTGFINEAGFTYACMSEQDDHQVMVVVFNSKSGQDRFDDAKALIEWAFKKYYWF